MTTENLLSFAASAFAVLFTLFRSSAARNIAEVDKRLDKIVDAQEAAAKESVAILLAVQKIEAATSTTQRELGGHAARLDKLEDKVAGLAEFWRDRWSSVRGGQP